MSINANHWSRFVVNLVLAGTGTCAMVSQAQTIDAPDEQRVDAVEDAIVLNQIPSLVVLTDTQLYEFAEDTGGHFADSPHPLLANLRFTIDLSSQAA